MELLKPKDNLAFSIGEVTFYFRPQLTVRDKFQLDMIGEYRDGVFTVTRGAVIEKLVELMVVSWNGVTEDGKPVPYSFKTFIERLPADVSNDWILRLGGHILETVGLIPKEALDEKNA